MRRCTGRQQDIGGADALHHPGDKALDRGNVGDDGRGLGMGCGGKGQENGGRAQHGGPLVGSGWGSYNVYVIT